MNNFVGNLLLSADRKTTRPFALAVWHLNILMFNGNQNLK